MSVFHKAPLANFCSFPDGNRCTESYLFVELVSYLFEALGRPNIALRGLAHTQVRFGSLDIAVISLIIDYFVI